jgi:AcrR family transcriptional regulator
LQDTVHVGDRGEARQLPGTEIEGTAEREHGRGRIVTGARRKQQAKPGAKEIEAAFARGFQENGYQATSVESVARELGVPKGSLFYHIGTKEDVFFRVQQQGMQEFTDSLRAIAEREAPAEERLREAIRDSIRRVDPSSGPLFFMRRDNRYLSTEHRHELQGVRDDYQRLFTKIILDGVDAGVFMPQKQLGVVVFGILRMIGNVVDWYRPGGPLSLEEIANVYWEFICRALGYDPAG